MGGFNIDSRRYKQLKEIERLENRVEELENILTSLGYCTDCNTIAEHHLTEPFSSCKCGTGEDTGKRPLQELQQDKINTLLRVKELLSHIDGPRSSNYDFQDGISYCYSILHNRLDILIKKVKNEQVR